MTKKHGMMTMSKANLWALLPDMAEEVLRQLAAESGAQNLQPEPGAFLEFLQKSEARPLYALENGVAVIEISGPIDRKTAISFWTGEPYTVGQNHIRGGIEEALNDQHVRGILLSFNSPGGVVAGTKELADFIASNRSKKPIAAYADGLCASAAYWLAAATGTIYAPATAQVGSIGVIAVLTDWTRAADKAGITRTVIHSGKWKAAGSPDKTLTDEERQIFQQRLENLHAIFRADVARFMNLPDPLSSGWAEGQTFLGEEALALGLVSQIVRDRSCAASLLAAKITEESMDLTQLKAEHPELVQAIMSEAQAEARAASDAALANARSNMLAFVRAIAGEEAASQVESLVQSGISAKQLEALAPIITSQKSPSSNAGRSGEQEAREQMLEAISQASGGPLPAGTVPTKGKSALVADAERRAAAASFAR